MKEDLKNKSEDLIEIINYVKKNKERHNKHSKDINKHKTVDIQTNGTINLNGVAKVISPTNIGRVATVAVCMETGSIISAPVGCAIGFAIGGPAAATVGYQIGNYAGYGIGFFGGCELGKTVADKISDTMDNSEQNEFIKGETQFTIKNSNISEEKKG
jgi:hypothetical protein